MTFVGPACRIRACVLPTGSTARPGLDLTASIGSITVALTWQSPARGDPPTSYVIEAGSSPGASNLASIDTGSSGRSFTATGIAAGTYDVRVRARNAGGTSEASNEIVVTVGTAGCSPSAPSGLAGSVSGSSVTLNWTPTGQCPATTYVIEAGSSPGAADLANFQTGNAMPSFFASRLPAGRYYVRVRAATRDGTSAASNEIVVVVPLAAARTP